MPKITRMLRLNEVFTPSAPVSNRDRFAGRVDEVVAVVSALNQAGKHVLLYGERGVGKTSLANVITDFLRSIVPETATSVRINCTTQDNYKTIWTKVMENLDLPVPEQWVYGSPDPDSVRIILAALAPPRIVILDEFDRVDDDDALSLMADTIKALSDHDVKTKLVVVGVADSIDQLIGEHESVQRAIEEIQLPRMTQSEAATIIDNGLSAVGMTIVPGARTRITRLAEGLPHYVHLLTVGAALHAVKDDRLQVEPHDVLVATQDAVAKHSVLKEYQTAVQSPRRDNLFARVLAACALAEKNRLGQFTASAVREPMTRIMGRGYDIPAFAPHLKAFTEFDRGQVLRREGSERKYTYRFRNPLLQPFSVLVALAEGLIPDEYANELMGDYEQS
jgi:Cdc6-like AAA superfamily ATPase